jgi:hypothetical protein
MCLSKCRRATAGVEKHGHGTVGRLDANMVTVTMFAADVFSGARLCRGRALKNVCMWSNLRNNLLNGVLTILEIPSVRDGTVAMRKEAVMANEIRLVDYYYTMVPDKSGEAARVLAGLRDAGVNLIAFCGFPEKRKGQLDFIPSEAAAFLAAAKMMKLSLSRKKRGFLVQGDDQPGAVAEFMEKLGAAKINVVSMQAISAGAGRYGGILWVKAADVRKAAKALGLAQA